MEKTTKKIIAFIVGVTFAAAIFVALAWATSGFRNWNAAMWFDCWGKGTPQEVSKTEHEKPEANGGMRKTAARAGVVNDSDDSELTVTVQRYSSPSFTFSDNKVSILGGTHGDILRFDFNNGEYVRDFDYANATGYNNNKFELTYTEWAELWQSFGGNVAFLNVYNVGKGEYLNSVGYSVASNFVPRPNTELGANDGVCYVAPIVPYFDGVKVIVPMPENKPAGFGYAVTIGKGYSGSALPEGKEYFNYDGKTDASAVEVFDDRYEIDLSLIGFVNEVRNVCFVHVRPFRTTTYSNTRYNVLCPEYEINFSITKLAAPTNLRLDGNELAWDAVDGAEGYLFSCSGSQMSGKTVTEPKIHLDDLKPDEYTFRVRALGNVGTNLARMGKATAFNANSVITQVVTLTYNIDGDTVTKFVPLGKSVGDYLYDVTVDGREFGGWYYDSGFSSAVNSRDKLENDTTIYARLSDKLVTERPLTWWERNMWYVLAPCIAVVVLALLVGVGIAIKKRKSA